MVQNITKRLAARNLNTAKVPAAWLFKIVEMILGSRIISVSTHRTRSDRQFCAIAFETIEDAKKIYDFCDGLHIEDTGECLDLAFIPDGMDIGPSVDICNDGKEFRYFKASASSKAVNYSNMVEVSDENDELGEEVPGRLREKEDAAPPVEQPKNPAREREMARREHIIATTVEALRRPETADELEGFLFDVTDSRFDALLNNNDFLVDASHKKFNKQSGMAEVLDVIRRRYDYS